MNVKLISLSQSNVTASGAPLTPDDLLVYIARVSNPSNQLNTETGPNLLAYCIEHGHWSVFEHAYMTVEIETSLAIAMQILRHRSFTFQMFSQRYAEVSKLGDIIEPVQLRVKAAGGNRQGSGGEVGEDTQIELEYITDTTARSYAKLLNAGVAPESARFILPQCTKTRLYMTGCVRSWIHYLAQRTELHAQLEHREVARAIEVVFKEAFPTVAAALANNSEKCAFEKNVVRGYYLGEAERLGYTEIELNQWRKGDGPVLKWSALCALIRREAAF